MTLQGAIVELKGLMNQDDIPFYYKGAIQKVIETVQMDCKEIITGEWIAEGSGFWKCNRCEYSVEPYNNTPFCPNCGADMRGEV